MELFPCLLVQADLLIAQIDHLVELFSSCARDFDKCKWAFFARRADVRHLVSSSGFELSLLAARERGLRRPVVQALSLSFVQFELRQCKSDSLA